MTRTAIWTTRCLTMAEYVVDYVIAHQMKVSAETAYDAALYVHRIHTGVRILSVHPEGHPELGPPPGKTPPPGKPPTSPPSGVPDVQGPEYHEHRRAA